MRKILLRIEYILLDIEDICSRVRRKIKGYRWKIYPDI